MQTATHITQAQTLKFHDEGLSEEVKMGVFSGGDYDHDSDVTGRLSDYLSRPVRIATLNWTIGSAFTPTTYSPWSLFFNTSQIKSKLQNFGKLRCKLHLKFLINGSPFDFGLLRACYFPLADERSTYVAAGDLIPFSQVPGISLSPQNMTTSEMELPFLWPHSWLEVTALSDFTRMGSLTLVEYAQLASANGATGAVTVSIYAWATEVEVMGPTSVGALQGDEYEESKGTVSGPASAVASVASKLTSVPVIGPFARATEVGARATASIARLFGFSNPPMIDDVHAFQNKSFHAFANSETRMPIDKLALDPKNEVTISSEVAGVKEEDPLVFTNLLTKESYIDGFTFSTQTVDTLLWSTIVSPHYAYLSGGFRTMPTVTYVSPNFRFWRGSVVYRFKFIKTQYHRGRVLISYDPNGDISGNADTETTNFTRIVDLSSEEEVEFAVPYKATAPLLTVPTFTTFPLTYSSSSAPSYTYDSAFYNGSLTMRVQNTLSGPTTTAAIKVLVFVRAGDDFQFAAPTSLPGGVFLRDPTGVIQSSETVESIASDANESQAKLGAITTGETIASFRPLLHRTHYILTQGIGGGTNTTIKGLLTTYNVYSRIPPGLGRSSTGYNLANVTTSVPYNFCMNNPLDWITDCFVGVRGSVNAHVNVNPAPASVSSIGTIAISRNYGPTSLGAFRNTNGVTNVYSMGTSPYGGMARALTRGDYNSGAGVTITNPATQTAVSANIPQYWPTRFIQAFHTKRGVDPKSNTLVNDNFSVCTRGVSLVTDSDSPTTWPTIDLFQSAGVDYQLVFYLCTPRVFAGTVPAAVDS